MAIIKCPECGRQVSEKAPICPACGVEIAGKVERCSNCGEVYFIADRLCPACHSINGAAPRPVVQPTVQQHQPAQPQPSAAPYAGSATANADNAPVESQPEKKQSHWGVLLVSFIFAAIICGGMFYFYQRSQTDKEQEEYALAMKSEDQLILESYLAKFNGVNDEHYINVDKRLKMLQAAEAAWQNILNQDSRSAYKEYLEMHPESSHRQVILNKLDSIDWVAATKASPNDAEMAMQGYVNQHPDGAHVSDARAKLDQLKEERESTEVKPEERGMVNALLSRFFMSMNRRNSDTLLSTLSNVFASFNGRTSSPSDEAVKYMNDLFRSKPAQIIWGVVKESCNIQKQRTPDGNVMLTVDVPVKLEVENADHSRTTTLYNVNANVGSDGLLTTISIR